MNKAEAKAALEVANQSLAIAAEIVRSQRETLELLVNECRHFESVGPICDPTLWRSSERQVVAGALVPIYIAALAFERVYAERTAALKEAAAKVGVAIGASA